MQLVFPVPLDRVLLLFLCQAIKRILAEQHPAFVYSRHDLAKHLGIAVSSNILKPLIVPSGFSQLPKAHPTDAAQYQASQDTIDVLADILAGNPRHLTNPLFRSVRDIVEWLCSEQVSEPSTDSVYVRALLTAQVSIHKMALPLYKTLYDASKGLMHHSTRNKRTYSYTLFKDDMVVKNDQRQVFDPVDVLKYPLVDSSECAWQVPFYNHIAEAIRMAYPKFLIHHSDMASIVQHTHEYYVAREGDAHGQVACLSYFQKRYGLNGERITPSLDPIDKLLEDVYVYTLFRVCAELGIHADKQWFHFRNHKERNAFIKHCDALTKDAPILGTFRTLLALTRNVNDFMHLNPTKIE